MFLSIFAGAKYFSQDLFERHNENEPRASAIEIYSEIEDEANLDNSGDLKSIAMAKVATKKAENLLNSQTSDIKKKQIALSTFMGYYLVNYKARHEYCLEKGINISSFTDRFKSIHESELSLAKQYIFKDGLTSEKMYSLIEPQLNKLLKQDMEDISTSNSISLSEACELIKSNGVSIADTMAFSVSQPLLYVVIHK